MKKSKIFTDSEIKILQDRIKGEKADRTGIFYSRIRPKILELLEWFKKKKELQKAIKPIKRKKK